MHDAATPVDVLILGAGINGAAVARELVLNGLSVIVVDANDLAFGATSRSSRLIHGGLRYLEHGDIALVAESLRERAILLRTAPQFVRPLRLHIPVRRRLGGLVWSALKLFGWDQSRLAKAWLNWFPNARERGLWVARLGLWLYSRLARETEGSGAQISHLAGDRQDAPAIKTRPNLKFEHPTLGNEYRWVCSYSDAQITFPERFVVAMLEDARRAAAQQGLRFEVRTHTWAEFGGRGVRLCDRILPELAQGKTMDEFLEPSVLINATGAWGDGTLAELRVNSPRLFGGTKGSHFVTASPPLRQAIGDAGLYAEAADGRLVFILPFSSNLTLVGTTDEPFDARPDTAIAEPREIDYLLGLVNEVLPSARLTREDVLLHYCGVRPLPYGRSNSPASIPRGHWIDENHRGSFPILTLIGGKLTTCRALAEEVADRILRRMQRRRAVDSRERMLPGAASFPPDEASLQTQWSRLSERFGLTLEQVQSVWRLIGNRFDDVFDSESFAATASRNIVDTHLPRRFAEWVIRQEWVRSLSDLVERRLMLIYEPRLTKPCLRELAELLAAADVIVRERIDDEVDATRDRLRRIYGRDAVD